MARMEIWYWDKEMHNVACCGIGMEKWVDNYRIIVLAVSMEWKYGL